MSAVCFNLERLAQKHQKQIPKLNQIQALLTITGFLSNSIPATTVRPPTALYNILIKGCLLRHPHAPVDAASTAFHLFTQMLFTYTPPSAHTFPSLIKASAAASSSGGARALHAQVARRGLETDSYIVCCLLNFYANCGHLCDAQKVFDNMSRSDVVLCNAMLDALCKNGEVGMAAKLFVQLPERDVVSWTTVINGFVRNRNYEESVHWFRMMIEEQQRENPLLKPNESTLVCVLSGCANSDGLGALLKGREVHGYTVRHEFEVTPFLGTALVDMYGKSGHLHCAANVFGTVKEKVACTWNAMISALACNGKEEQALDMFEKMRGEGILPNDITFVAVLTACARAQLVECGSGWFKSMSHDFRIVPKMEHYGCMVDLFGRAGLMDEAIEVIKRMPFEPDASVLGALLGACKVHGDVHLAGDVGEKLLALQPWHSGRYIVLSNIYAGAKMWRTASELKEAMEKGGVKKIAGYSVVDSGNVNASAVRGLDPDANKPFFSNGAN